MIRIPIMHIKGIPEEFVARYLAERARGEFASLADFLERCRPGEAESLALLDSGALDCFGLPRPFAFWHIRRYLHTTRGFAGRDSRKSGCEKGFSHQLTLGGAPGSFGGRASCTPQAGETPAPQEPQEDLPPVELSAPDLWQVARREMDLLGFPISIDPLTLLGADDQGHGIDWTRYVPVNELDRYYGRRVTVCGIMIADRINLTTGGDLMKFVSLADRTGVVETFLFPDTYRRFGHLTASNPILAATGIVEPFENRNGFNLRVEQVTPPARTGAEVGV